MKKVIRRGVFETNSSSVHTMVVQLKSKIPLKKMGLVEKNILYPSVFYHTYTEPTETQCGGDLYNGKQWVAYTFDEKAALLMLYMNEMKRDCDGTVQRYLCLDKDIVYKAIHYIKMNLPYNDVVLEDTSISIYEDRGEVTFSFIEEFTNTMNFSFDEIMEKIIDPFLEVIKDETKYILVRQGRN